MQNIYAMRPIKARLNFVLAISCNLQVSDRIVAKMHSSLAVLFFLGLVVVFSNAETTQNDFDILTPEGNYKHGNFNSINSERTIFKNEQNE